MQEGDIEAFGALARGFVDQLHTLFFKLGQVGLQAIDGDRQMLDALAFLLDELADWAFRIGRFKQFDLRLANLKEGG